MWVPITTAWCVHSFRQPIRGGLPAWGLGKGLTTTHHKNTCLLQNVTLGIRIGWILWNDLGNGTWISVVELGMLGVCRGLVHWKQ